ncbi:MAG: hypothetical protein WCI97_06450 [Bacteroidota bacterium]
MKTEIINGQFKTKSNVDFEDEIISSPDFKLKHIEQLKVTAESNGDGEIVINAIIPFDGKLVISRSAEKNALPLISVEATKGFFITNIPVSMHDETEELDCILTSAKRKLEIKIELKQEEVQL